MSMFDDIPVDVGVVYTKESEFAEKTCNLSSADQTSNKNSN
jgi:hypothetical protein